MHVVCDHLIFARNYGTAAVVSYNLKGIAPPVPPVQCWANKNLMSGCAAPTLFNKFIWINVYIYITHLKARSKTARYERDSLKSSHARHLPASNYMIICTVIYLYTHSIHIRTLTDKAHRDGLHTQTGYTQTLKGHFPSQSPRTRDFIM